MKKAVFVFALALAGCAGSPKFVEGTSVQLGAYVPWNSNLYGVELLSYVNGCVVRVPTNGTYEITRRHASTNDWCWGMLKTVELTDTTIKLVK